MADPAAKGSSLPGDEQTLRTSKADVVEHVASSADVMIDPAYVGQVIAEKYRIERVLGSSGMGVVYLATHLEIDQTVAIKFLLNGAKDAAALARFRREARAMGRVRSEHAVRVIDVGQLDANTPFIVMDYLEGRDLSSLMKEMGRAELPFAAEVLLQVCEGLAAAHAAGVIHRDLKPSNIFLTAQADGNPHVKVIDFGVAKLRGNELDKADNVTQSSSLIGSPRYMAPEQIRGDTGSLDGRVDVWALGVILQEMLTGKRVFRAEGVGPLLVAIATEAPGDILEAWPQAPEGIVMLLRRTLQKNPDHRTPDVGAFADALAAFTPGGRARAMRIQGALMTERPQLPSGALTSAGAPPSVSALPVAPAWAPTMNAPLPAAPDLDLPPRSAPAPLRAPAPAPVPAPAPAPSARVRPSALAAVAAGPSSVRSQNMAIAAPPPSARTHSMAPHHPHASMAPSDRQREERPDVTGFVGLAVVSLVAILGMGALTRFARSTDGWAIAYRLGLPANVVGPVQGVLALCCVVFAGWRVRQGARSWGDAGGGRAVAVINAVVAAVAFFAALELGRLAW